jgi:type 1 glutamine amidotransferase
MRRILNVTLPALAALVLAAPTTPAADDARPIKLLIITGDNVAGHKWKETTPLLKDFLSEGGRIKVDVTTTPGKDLTDENLANYDVLLLNYRDTPQGEPDTKWSDANKAAFLKAVRENGKGLVSYHFSSAAFVNPNWKEYEQAVAGGWRTQGYHGPPHEFTVKKTAVKHPISDGLPASFNHITDELYSASMRTRGSVVLATAYSDPAKPQGTGMDEPVVWVNQFGKGRVVENVLGHDAKALTDKPVQEWFRRCVEWAATGKVGSSGN